MSSNISFVVVVAIATKEMIRILQDYGEVTCCFGSMLNVDNTNIFLQADCRSTQPLLLNFGPIRIPTVSPETFSMPYSFAVSYAELPSLFRRPEDIFISISIYFLFSHLNEITLSR